MTNMTYAGSGVPYDKMDPFKVKAQKMASTTNHMVERFGFKVLEWTRGESVFLIQTPLGVLAFVVEGLGTKNLVADTMYRLAKLMQDLSARSFYDAVAQCTVAMIVNDMITLGARPICLGQYLAVGSADWFDDEARAEELIKGTHRAALLARCTWGPGETPTLRDVILPDVTDLAGAAMGWIPAGSPVINPSRIQHGDVIVILESSGIHANGLTLARKIAEKLSPDPKRPELGYLTHLPNGRTYGETLLDPTHIYVGFVEDCLNAGVDPHYAVNITGHGWRKFMRAPQPFTYVIDTLPRQQMIFDFIQEHGPVEEREMYGNYNMGAGFALYVSPKDAMKVMELGLDPQYDFDTVHAGHVESGDKKVVIKPRKIEFAADTLAVR